MILIVVPYEHDGRQFVRRKRLLENYVIATPKTIHRTRGLQFDEIAFPCEDLMLDPQKGYWVWGGFSNMMDLDHRSEIYQEIYRHIEGGEKALEQYLDGLIAKEKTRKKA